MTTQYQHLFKAGRIGALEIENRIVKSPQATATSNIDGTVTSRTVEHYRRLGEGGIGLVMVWRRRETYSGRVFAVAAVVVTTAWAWVLLSRVDWQPWLRWFTQFL